jgi:hypothetical protein
MGPIREIRTWWRIVHPPPKLTKRLEPAYYVAITLLLGGPFVYGTASSALADVATAHAVAVWGPSLALVALIALMRWGAIQGPVVFSVADVAQLLGAPLHRDDLVLWRLIRGFAWTAGGSAVVASIALIGVAGHHRGIAIARGAGFVVAVIALGLLGIAVASLVQGSRRWDRWTRRAVWPVSALAAGFVFAASSGATGRHVVQWSGPWGWTIQTLSAGAAWPAALVLMVVLSAASVTLAMRRRGMAPTERHMLRAEARGGAVAALYSFNSRYVGRNLSAVSRSPGTTRAARLPLPRSPRLAVAWRDAVAALSTPQRLGEALVLAGGGTLVMLLNADHPAAVIGGTLAVFAGASRLLEPLRAETDAPSRVRVMMRAPMSRVMTQHALVPGFVVLLAAGLAAGGTAVAGALPRHGGAAALLAVSATPAITLCAALSSRRGGQLPTSLLSMTYADTSGMSGALIIGWIVAWPLLAIALGTIPVCVVVAHGTRATGQFMSLLVALPILLRAGLGWSRFTPS